MKNKIIITLMIIVISVIFIVGCGNQIKIQNIVGESSKVIELEQKEEIILKNEIELESEIMSKRSKNLSKQLTNLRNERENADSKVFFTSDISSEGMIKIYDALNSDIFDDVKLGSKVAVKLSTGEAGNNHYLHPELIGDLVHKVNGTIVECNTAYNGKRSKTEDHMKVAEEHGFTKIGNVDIMDNEDDVEIPVSEKATILDKDIVGSHLNNYDSILCLSHFKGHQMAGFGGAIKNMSIGVASVAGKVNIHSACRTTKVEEMWNYVDDQVGFEKAMSEAADAVRNYMNKKVLYINVMNNISIDCDCNGNPAEPDMHDVGILASYDPVALDSACVDIIYNTDREQSEGLINRIEDRQGIIQLTHSVEIGAGNMNYKLVNIDKNSNLSVNKNIIKSDSAIKNNKVINLAINNNIFEVELENNITTRELIDKLKISNIEFEVDDYENFEKVGVIPFSLTKDDKSINIKSGDIVLYNGNSISIFYNQNSWSYTKLGRIKGDISNLKEKLGNGKQKVVLSMNKSNIMVAYFSAEGHTERVAKEIARVLDANEFIIEPETPYSKEDLDWTNKQSRTSFEVNSNKQIIPLKQSKVDLRDYDTIFIGAPIWWGNASWVINSFLTDNIFIGKNIYVFVTSHSSGIGNSVENVKKFINGGSVVSGKRFSQDVDLIDVEKWINEIIKK